VWRMEIREEREMWGKEESKEGTRVWEGRRTTSAYPNKNPAYGPTSRTSLNIEVAVLAITTIDYYHLTLA
jgi:hypothetical protein